MKNKIKLGIFFIVTLFLFVCSIMVFGKFKVKGDGYRLFVDYVFIGDLQVNGKVSYRGGGINIGFIEDITINPDGTIRVVLFITDKKVILPEGTRFSIQTVGLGLGEKYIMATPPTITTTGLKSLPPDSVVKGVEPFSLESTLGSIGDIGKEFNFQELSSMITNFTDTISIISEIIQTNEQAFNDIIINVAESARNIKHISSNLSEILYDVNSGNGVLGASIKDYELRTNIIETIANLKVFSEKVKDNPSVLLFRETRTNR